jgi:hypothetical protein
MSHAKHGWERARMPRRRRVAVYLVLGGLWVTGCWWLLLDQFVAKRGPFGVTPHPLEPPLLLVHGVTAVLGMYLLGWISSRHVLRWWPGGLRRLSGTALALMLALLVISGFALFFVSDDEWQHAAAVIHEVLGVAVTLFAVQHWFFRGRDEPLEHTSDRHGGGNVR